MRGKLAEFRLAAEKTLGRHIKVKWVREENLHLTVKFFGEVTGDQIETLENALSEAAGRCNHFEVEVKGAGCFPNIMNARVLWAGVDEKLTGLADAVESAAVREGLAPSDKPFSPHLTLARFGTRPDAGLKDIVNQYSAFSFGRFDVNGMTLFQSRLMPDGPQYTILKNFPLKNIDAN